VVTTGYDDDNDKGANNSNKEQVTAIEHDFKCHERQPIDHYMKLLKATFLNYAYPMRHKLKVYHDEKLHNLGGSCQGKEA
jgi:hypothetical protein